MTWIDRWCTWRSSEPLVKQGRQGAAAIATERIKLSVDSIVRLDRMNDLPIVINSEIGRAVFASIAVSQYNVVWSDMLQIGDIILSAAVTDSREQACTIGSALPFQ